MAAQFLVLVAEDLVATLAFSPKDQTINAQTINASISALPCIFMFTTVPGKGVAEDKEEKLNS